MEASEYLRPKAFRNNAINFKLKLRFECFFLSTPSRAPQFSKQRKLMKLRMWMAEWQKGGKKCENDNGRRRFQFPFGIFFIKASLHKQAMLLPHLFTPRAR